MLLRRTALVLSLWCQAGGDRGVDTSTWGAAWSESDFVCLKEEGNAFVIIEAFRRSSSVLVEARQTVVNARQAGFDDVQLYHFPDKAQDPALQIGETLDFFGSVAGNSTLWIDVEGPQFWQQANCSANVLFLASMLSAARDRLGADKVGIYTSLSQWQPIMCNSTAFANETLWRPHYDGKADNSDWHDHSVGPFGGWESAAIKQYNGTTSSCGMNVDLDWRFGV